MASNSITFKVKVEKDGNLKVVAKEADKASKSTDDLINDWLGYGSFSRSEIKNKIHEQTEVNIWFSRFYEGFNGSAKTENTEELLQTIIKLKPNSTKGTYVNSIFLSSTMGIGVEIESKSLI